MKSVFFVSTVTGHMEMTDVRTFATNAARNNRLAGITGLLAFNGINFLQLTEGSDLAVEECFRRISANPKHSGIITFGERRIVARQLRNWRLVETRADKANLPPFVETGTRRILDRFYQMAA